MGKALIAVVAVALAVYSLFDVIATPLAWLLLGTRRQGPASRGPGPRRPRPLGPDDDPDYLRDL